MSFLRKAAALLCIAIVLMVAFTPAGPALLAACVLTFLVFGVTLQVRPVFRRLEKAPLPQAGWVTASGARAPPLG